VSEPYIRLYVADMRADPKFYRMNADMRLALIHAWDLAKNGPGDVCELRANEGRAMRERELRTLSNVSGAATRRMFERWASVGLCELEEEDGETLVVFPTLAKRQGIDRTNALRQKRFRERQRNARRNAQSNAVSNGPKLRGVTGENQNQNTRKESVAIAPDPSSPKASPPARKPDPIWDALIAVCPVAGEMTKAERGRRNNAAKQLREISADPGDIAVVARHLAQKWQGRIAITPQAIVSNWSATLAEIHPNGHGPKLTAEDFDRIGLERDAAEQQQRLANAIASQTDLEDSPI
jgi:hypothetical protein